VSEVLVKFNLSRRAEGIEIDMLCRSLKRLVHGLHAQARAKAPPEQLSRSAAAIAQIAALLESATSKHREEPS
jgi:hypothetical protein